MSTTSATRTKSSTTLKSSSPAGTLASVLEPLGNPERRCSQVHVRNTAVTAALHGPPQGLEAAFRKAMIRKPGERYGVTRYDNGRAGLDRGALGKTVTRGLLSFRARCTRCRTSGRTARFSTLSRMRPPNYLQLARQLIEAMTHPQASWRYPVGRVRPLIATWKDGTFRLLDPDLYVLLPPTD